MLDKNFPSYFTPKNILFFVITILAVIFIGKIQDIIVMFFASYVIACSFEPLVQKFSTKFRRKTAMKK